MIQAQDARPRVIYRPTRDGGFGRMYYVLAPARAAERLVSRLQKKGNRIRTDELEELRAAHDALRGSAILFVRYFRGTDPMTKKHWEMSAYRSLPLDYKLRPVKRRPGFA